MAELRRVGGEMVPHRRPAGPRRLLPAEAELCNAVGLTEEEYWFFVDQTAAYNAERSKEYELIPDVRNEPVNVLFTLAIGVALSAVSALLAPKPKQQTEARTPQSLKTEDITGRNRFAPQTNFDSLQDLATLGEIIPLVFTRKGVRANGVLLWSQMLSLGNGQQLRALILFSSGRLEAKPDFAGFAIGDTTLENYTNAKLALYFRTNGGRIKEGGSDRYSQGTLPRVPPSDAFSIFWDQDGRYRPYFSGARTPSTQAQFGLYSPAPNGMMWRPQYDDPTIPDDSGKENKDRIRQKRNKARARVPYRAAVIRDNGSYVTYRLDASEDPGDRFEPWGSEDFKQSINGARESVDDSISVGSQYMIGTELVVCDSVPADPWEPGSNKDSVFRVIEPGDVDTAGVLDINFTADRLTLQSVVIGTISNNRACTVTELGIKSTVWGQVNGYANMNSHPGDDVIDDIGDDGGSFQLGTMNKYLKRLSFFQLQTRALGSNSAWIDISGGTLFCVKGRTPQAQYNWIRISHSLGQWEFRLRPYPGNAARRYFINRDVHLLRPGRKMSYSARGRTVAFEGKTLRLDPLEMSNPEWVIGEPPPTNRAIKSVNVTQSGTPGGNYETEYRFTSDSYTLYESNYSSLGARYITLVWDGRIILRSAGTTGTESGGYSYKAEYAPYGYVGKKGITRTSKTPSPISTTTVSASGGSGSGARFRVDTYENGAKTWTLVDGGSGYTNGENIYIPVANQTVKVTTDAQNILKHNWNPYDAVSDYPLVDAEKKSHMDGPEHEVVYVNEQVEQSAPQYDQLAYAGLRINSTKEWTSFSNMSAFIRRGVMVERIGSSGRSASNLMPEIAYALLTDPVLGAGNLIGADQVDRGRMAIAAKFCAANGFTWDGVISQQQNLREWIYQNAGYCLLDFTILGGRFSLVPAVPYKSNYTINRSGKVEIKALFTDGNIRKLQVSFLSPEERQLFNAALLWRQNRVNGFPETRTLSVRLSNAQGGSDADPVETFDMSGFCTTEAHALLFAQYALKTRQLVDHGVKFETTPQAAMNLAPGEYFKLVSEVTHTSRFNNGSIGVDGTIQSVDTLNGNYSILYWEPGTEGVKSATLKASKGRTTQVSLFGTVFTIQNSVTNSRVYKVETLSYGEDGLVEVSGSYAPLTGSGSLAVLDWSAADFVVEAG